MAFWNRGRQAEEVPDAPPALDDLAPALSPLHLACTVDWRCAQVTLMDQTGKKFDEAGMVLEIQAKPSGSRDEVTYQFFMTYGDVMTVGQVVGKMMWHSIGHSGDGAGEGCGES